jgi:hypothetical protein
VLSVPALGGFQMVTAGACESGVACCKGPLCAVLAERMHGAALCCFNRENSQWVAGGCGLCCKEVF